MKLILSIFLRLLFSIAISVSLIALLFLLLDIDTKVAENGNIITIIKAIDLTWLYCYCLIYCVTTLLRAWRYKILLMCTGEASVPAFSQILLVTAARNMFVDFLPARMGELSFVVLLNRAYGVASANAMSALSLSLLFDFIGLSFVLFGVLVLQITGQGIQQWLLLGFAILGLIGGLFYWMLYFLLPILSELLQRKFASENANSIAQKAVVWLESFNRSLQTSQAFERFSPLVSLSVVIRVLKYTGLCILFFAIAKNSFVELASLKLGYLIAALISGEIASSLPIPSFMGFGLYEAGGAALFSLFDSVNQASALMVLLCSHIVSQVLEYSVGLLVLGFMVMRYRNRLRGLK